jgi:hypothetical protein
MMKQVDVNSESHTHTHIQQPNVTRRDSAAGVDR